MVDTFLSAAKREAVTMNDDPKQEMTAEQIARRRAARESWR
jgi:hypothetical protein